MSHKISASDRISIGSSVSVDESSVRRPPLFFKPHNFSWIIVFPLPPIRLQRSKGFTYVTDAQKSRIRLTSTAFAFFTSSTVFVVPYQHDDGFDFSTAERVHRSIPLPVFFTSFSFLPPVTNRSIGDPETSVFGDSSPVRVSRGNS